MDFAVNGTAQHYNPQDLEVSYTVALQHENLERVETAVGILVRSGLLEYKQDVSIDFFSLEHGIQSEIDVGVSSPGDKQLTGDLERFKSKIGKAVARGFRSAAGGLKKETILVVTPLGRSFVRACSEPRKIAVDGAAG